MWICTSIRCLYLHGLFSFSHFFKPSSCSICSPFVEMALFLGTCLSQPNRAHLLAVFLITLFSIFSLLFLFLSLLFLFLSLTLFLSFSFYFSFLPPRPAPGSRCFSLDHLLVNSTSSLSIHFHCVPLTLLASITVSENQSPPSPFLV